MTPRAARLATIVLLALSLRAATAQQAAPAGGQRGDPYAPQYQPHYQPAQYQPPPIQPGPQPAPPGGERYPLPQVAAGYQQPPVQPPPPALPPAGPSTTLRYPLPPPAPTPKPPASPAPYAAPPVSPAPPAGDPFEMGKTVARVGDRVIFLGDVAPIVNMMFESTLAKAKSEAERAQIEQYREPMNKGVLRQVIDIKVKHAEFEREVRKNISDPKKFEEQMRSIQQRIKEKFETALAETRTKIDQSKPEQIQELVQRDPVLPRLALVMREQQIESLGELDAVLRRYGTTLDKQTRLWGEYVLGGEAINRKRNATQEVTHQEMLDYYHQHAADYAVPAKASFEILTARFANYPTRDAAFAAISQMGNAVFLGGVPFDAVARQHSQEPSAKNGGQYKDITQGSLASEPIDRAIFTIEPERLSQIIEDENGYHIVRVKARQEKGQVAFLEAQQKIKDAIELQKRRDDYKKIVEGLYARTEVWTIYDAALAERPSAAVPR